MPVRKKQCALFSKKLKSSLTTKSDNKNQDAAVDVTIADLAKKKASFIKMIFRLSSLIVLIIISRKKPNNKNIKYGTKSLFVDFLINSLVDTFLCSIPPLKKNQDMKNDKDVLINLTTDEL